MTLPSSDVLGDEFPSAEQILALAIPDGHYELAERDHRQFLRHVHALDFFPTEVGAPAHPIFAHLATHMGYGWTFNELLANIGSDPSAGVVFGGGTFTYHRPQRVGEQYVVTARMRDVQRKKGRRAGLFDAVTMALALIDEGGATVVETTETYIVPRRSAQDAPPSSAHVSEPSVATGGYAVGPITREDIVGIMGVMHDTNPVHLDAELARASGYRGPVHQGPANLAFIFNAIAARRGRTHDIRSAAFTFRATVTAGDRLEVRLSGAEDGVIEAELHVVGVGLALTCRAKFGAA